MTRKPPASAPAASRRPVARAATARGGLDDVEAGIVTLFGDLCVALGLARSYGQIFGLAFASPDPICFDDVVARLGMSKGSASQGLRVLRDLGALHSVSSASSAVVRPPSSDNPSSGQNGRREYFAPETSVRALVGAIIRQRIESPLASGTARLADLRARFESVAASPPSGQTPSLSSPSSALGPPPSESDRRREHLRLRLESLETWHCKARTFAPLLLKLSG